MNYIQKLKVSTLIKSNVALAAAVTSYSRFTMIPFKTHLIHCIRYWFNFTTKAIDYH